MPIWDILARMDQKEIDQAIERLGHHVPEQHADLASWLHDALGHLECQDDKAAFLAVLGFITVPAGISAAGEERFVEQHQKQAQRRMKRKLGDTAYEVLAGAGKWIKGTIAPHPSRMDDLALILGLAGDDDGEVGRCSCCHPG